MEAKRLVRGVSGASVVSTGTEGGGLMSDANTITSGGSANALAGPAREKDNAKEALPPAVVTAARVLEGIQSKKEWRKVIAFDHDGQIIAATVKPLDGEMDALTKLFKKREDTIASGIVLLNEQYDVHRYHPPVIYGRRGDPAVDEGEGIAICQVEKKATKQPVYCLITYEYPTLSARAVPQLNEFCETILAQLTP